MTSTIQTTPITREKVRRLMEAAKALPHIDTTQIESTEYDWNQPHHFSTDHLIALEIFSKKICLQVAKTFETLCTGDFEVTTTETKQYFAVALNDIISAEQQDHYFLPIVSDEQEDCGFLGISPGTAVTLVEQMLRETDGGNSENRPLSELEEVILHDLLSSILDSVSVLFAQNGQKIQRAMKIKKSGWPVDLPTLEDLTTINFQVQSEEFQVELNLTIRSSILDPIVGLTDHQGPRLTDKQVSNLIMKQAHKAPVEVVGQLAACSINLSDMLSLEPGDIVLLRKKVTDPIDVIINRKPVLRAYPVSSLDKYALLIHKEDESV